MKNEVYINLKNKITEMNKLNDEINFIEWNKSDGPKFESVEEMKDFENRIVNGEFEYLSEDENEENNIISTFKHTLDNYFFFIYTFKNENDYITYMTIKDLNDNYIMDHLYGKKCSDKEEAITYFEKLKNDITSNTLDYIFKNIIIDVENNIKALKNKLISIS